jgi:virginiamycin B lyase
MEQLRFRAAPRVRKAVVLCLVGSIVGVGALVVSPAVASATTSHRQHQEIQLDKRLKSHPHVRTCHKSKGLIVYPIAPPTCAGRVYMPASITTGPDGALWFTTYDSNLIGRTTTAGVTTFYPVPTKWNGVVWGNGGITSGSDGALWFIANSGLDIGRITTSGSASIFPLPSGIGLAQEITSGPDGALWFTVYNSSGGANAIGRIRTTGQFTIFHDPSLGTGNWNSATHRALPDITSGPDGALWFTCEYASNVVGPGAASIGRITTSGVVTSYPIPFDANPGPLTAGPDGAMWFAGADFFGGNAIGRVTMCGVFSEFSGHNKIGQVLALTAGPDGALWFTNYTVPGDTGFVPYPPIGRITTKGTITTYGNPRVEKGAISITAGSDGAMWFIDHVSDTIGRVSVP